MKIILRLLGVLLLIAILAFGVIVLPPALFLAHVWWNDQGSPLTRASAGVDDVSRLHANKPEMVVPVDGEHAEAQLSKLLRDAATEGRKVSISGARHSMGGHTLYPGGVVLDMLPFNGMELDAERKILRVGSGARWSDIIPYLDARGFAVAIMQSNNDFTVGGSLSVNCHGWQHNSPPIASSVESFRLITADGLVRKCSRSENPELFSLALGGYGLFGVILDVELRLVANEVYRGVSRRIPLSDYTKTYREMTRDNPRVGMAYGRICVAPKNFLQEAVIVAFERTNEVPAPMRELGGLNWLKRLAFRGSVGSDYGKNLRWDLETLVGERGKSSLSRNEIMNEPSEWFSNRDEKFTEILHEYFVPVDRLAEFVGKVRPIFLKNSPDLLNITVRNVETDTDTVLRYAREEVFGLVMLFDYPADQESDGRMRDFTREMIDAALSCGGTYYLPYRLHATEEQFVAAYPMAREFFARKAEYDPQFLFQNRFFSTYGKPLLSPQQ